MSLDHTLPTKRKGKKYTPAEMKAARSFFKFTDDMCRLKVLKSMTSLPEKERRQWDRKLAKREFFKAEELPKEARKHWEYHEFLRGQFLTWMKLISEPKSNETNDNNNGAAQDPQERDPQQPHLAQKRKGDPQAQEESEQGGCHLT